MRSQIGVAVLRMAQLKRHLSLTKLTFYGVGDIVGAGIYALVGKVAAEAGPLAWFAFLISTVAAIPTALSYAELTSRYPRSGGAAVFVGRAFRNAHLPFVVGFLVLLSGLVSAGAASNAFHGYLSTFFQMPRPVAILFFLAGLTWFNFRGIEESSRLNILCVIAEVGGLLLIIAFGIFHWGETPLLVGKGPSLLHAETLQGIGAASVLAFYATIGFEDLCNVSEEVKEPEKTIPRALLLCLTITSLLYIGIAITVVSVASLEELASSPAPLAMVAGKIIPFFSPKVIALLAVFSLTNTALANMIMASRLLYGMAREGWVFKSLGIVHEKRQTPVVAVVTVFFVTLVLALTGTIKLLGQSTSVLLLSVFIVVNLSLVVIRMKNILPDQSAPDSQGKIFRLPLAVPFFGILVSLLLLTQAPVAAFVRVGLLLGIGIILSFVYRLRQRPI